MGFLNPSTCLATCQSINLICLGILRSMRGLHARVKVEEKTKKLSNTCHWGKGKCYLICSWSYKKILLRSNIHLGISFHKIITVVLITVA